MNATSIVHKDDLLTAQLTLNESIESASNKVVGKMQCAVGIAATIILTGVGCMVAFAHSSSQDISAAKLDTSMMRIDGMEKRLADKIDALDQKFDTQFAAVDVKLKSIDDKLDRLLLAMKP